MKRLIFICVTLVLMIGCEGDKSLPRETAQELEVIFATTGKYDLSKYLFPSEEQISNYRDKIYSSGEDHKYASHEDNETFYSESYQVDESQIDKYDNDGRLIVKYAVQQDRLKGTLVDDNNRTLKIARYVDVSSYIILNSHTVQEQGREGNKKLSCEVAEYIENKTVTSNTYNNVLKITCQIDNLTSGDFNGNNFMTKELGTHILFYAKEKGMIKSIEDICSTDTLNSLSTTKCKKTVTEITTIN